MGTSLTILTSIIYITNSIDCINLEDNYKCPSGCTETNSTTTCSCSTDGLTDLYFSIPTHQTSEWNSQMSMIQKMIDAAVKPTSGVGIQTYGNTANQIIPITNISTLTYPTMDSLIDNIVSTTDEANNLQLAMDNAISAFSTRNEPKREKFHIIIINSNPTSTNNYYDIVDICSKSTQVKQQSYALRFLILSTLICHSCYHIISVDNV